MEIEEIGVCYAFRFLHVIGKKCILSVGCRSYEEAKIYFDKAQNNRKGVRMIYRKIFINDFKKNRASHVILYLFMTLSAAIAVSVCVMVMHLFASITSMYQTAKPPHFLQMHKGEIVQEDIDAFNQSYTGITHWQTVPMIDVYGEEITVIPAHLGAIVEHSEHEENIFTLETCRLDLSLVKQNEDHDILLDGNRKKLEIGAGEIGVPVILLEQYDIEVGDILCIKSGTMEKDFIVSDYVYDGLMNSTLCSSTRFLINEQDYYELYGKIGEKEYLIEAYFTDSAKANAYQTAYEQSDRNLPKDGQAITYTMIFLLSAMTDIMMAIVFLLVGILLLVISMICLRYIILTELEDDMQEIGTMKSIGISSNCIKKLYLGKIRVLMIAGCVSGLVAAVFLVKLLTGRMNRIFGEQPIGMSVYGLAVLVSIVVYGMIILFSRKVLERLRKASVMELLVEKKGFHHGKSGYGIIFGILLLITFLMLVPYRMVQTMENEAFITYMGSAVCDVLLEVEQGERLEERRETAEHMLQIEKKDGFIEEIDVLKRVRLQAESESGELVGIHIDTGEAAGKGLQYLAGNKPDMEDEIALSSLMAEELGKAQGDRVVLIADGKRQEFKVCGIYQDVTSGGKTAKAVHNFAEVTAEQYTYQIYLEQEMEASETIGKWAQCLGNGYSIEDMEEFLSQTLGGVSIQVRQGSVAAFVIGLLLTTLITLLFLKFHFAREAGELAIKRAIGIPFSAICMQELYPVLTAGGIGMLAGALLVETVGDKLVSMLIGMLGIGLTRIEFARLTVLLYVVVFGVLALTLIIVTRVACERIRKMDIINYLNE